MPGDPVPAAQPDRRLTIDEMVAYAQRVRDGNNSGERSAWLLAGHLLSVAAELRRTEADLAVAARVAAERGQEASSARGRATQAEWQRDQLRVQRQTVLDVCGQMEARPMRYAQTMELARDIRDIYGALRASGDTPKGDGQ